MGNRSKLWVEPQKVSGVKNRQRRESYLIDNNNVKICAASFGLYIPTYGLN